LQHDDGHYQQVGSTCLQDFLGGKSPDDILAFAQMLDKIDDVFSEGDYYGSREPLRLPIGLVLTVAVMCVRKLGWVSRTTSKDTDQMSTSDIVWQLLTAKKRSEVIRDFGLDVNRKGEFVGYDLTVRDEEIAQDVLRWVRHELEVRNDYTANLQTACEGQHVTHKTIGIACSAISAYERHMARKLSAPANNSQYIGMVSQRIKIKVRIVDTKTMPSMYGVRTMVKMDHEGNTLIWWTGESPDWVKQGEEVVIAATIKEHKEYRGHKQTILTRATDNINAKGLVTI